MGPGGGGGGGGGGGARGAEAPPSPLSEMHKLSQNDLWYMYLPLNDVRSMQWCLYMPIFLKVRELVFWPKCI